MSSDRLNSSNVESIDQEILIPKESFTAFRFLYGDAKEISHVSRVVLLGSIPKLWYREQNSSLLRNWTKASYSRFQKTIRGVGRGVNSTYKFGANELYKDPNIKKLLFLTRDDESDISGFTDDDGFSSDQGDGDDEEDDDDYLVDNDILGGNDSPHIASKVRRASTAAVINSVQKQPNPEASTQEKMETSKDISNNIPVSPMLDQLRRSGINGSSSIASMSNNTPMIKIEDESQISDFRSPKQNTMELPDSSVQSFYSAQENLSTENTRDQSSPPELNVSSSRISTSSIETVKPKTPETPDNLDVPQSTKSRYSSFDSNKSDQESAFSVMENPKVRFQQSSTSTKPKGKSVSAQFLKPQPEENPIILPLDPRHERALNRIKAVASRTKRHVRNDLHNINQRRIFHKLLKNYKVGEIVKMERMLVLVKQAMDSSGMVLTTFTEVEPCDTRILERWKEYIVVARTTGDFDEPILIQFYTKREIPHDETSKHSDDDLDFTLNKCCLVNFYSSLDKTIAIVKKGKVFILRCQTPTSSIHWLTFLNETLGHSNPGKLIIQIPKLSVSINIRVTSEVYQKLTEEENAEHSSLIYKNEGYLVKELPILEYLVQKIKLNLVKSGYGSIVDDWNNKNLVLAFCWRHYDRLEWIFGETLSNLFWEQSMYSTHDLELRVSSHYPAEITNENNQKLEEPAPIEGFLARLSSRRGTHRNYIHKQIFKFSYFFTNNRLLFFSRSYKALPPIPEFEYLSDCKFLSNPENFEKIRHGIPPIYHHNPYRIDDAGHIDWLNPSISSEEFGNRDRFASYEYERRVASILRADAVIDMLEIVNVKAINADSLPVTVRAADIYAWEELTGKLKDESEEMKDSFFQIEFQNGSFFTLKAPSRTIRTEWVDRLNQLVTYWKLRVENDVEKIHEVKFSNINKLSIDDYMEANVGEATPKWENSRGLADPAIHNISSNAMFRPLVRCGLLYQKPKKHTVFKNYFVCLIPGFIILYKVFVRNLSGIALPTTHYKHYLTIPLDECYIYSGSTSGIDLLKRDSEIDNVNLGRNSLPRIYKDGWISSEDEASRCFTLWFGTKRAITGKMLMKSDEGNDFNEYGSQNPGIIKMVSRLGVTGRSVVFMCRSRQERDLWVNNIYTEVERFHKAEDVKV